MQIIKVDNSNYKPKMKFLVENGLLGTVAGLIFMELNFISVLQK